MKLRKNLALILVVVLSLTLFGCAKKQADAPVAPTATAAPTKAEAKTIKVAFNGDAANKDAVKKIFDKFTDANPNIKVQLQYIPAESGSGWNEYFTKLQTMVAGGSAPDVTFVAIEGIQMLDKLKLAKPLNDYIAKYTDVVGDAATDINAHLQAPFIINGNNYGLVTEWNNVVTHFNTKLLKEAGLDLPKENWNEQEFLEYAKKLTKTVNGKKQYAIALPNFYFAAEAWLYNNGASILNEDMTKCTLNTPAAQHVLQLWQDLIYKYKYAPFPEPGVDYTQQFMQGNVAMVNAGRWLTQNYTDNKFKDVAVQYLPQPVQNKVVFGSGAFIVLNASKNPDEAAKVALWTGGKDFTTAYLGASSIPARKSVASAVIPSTYEPQNNQIFYATADKAIAVQAPPQYPAIATVFDKYLSAILSNQMKVPEATEKATKEIDAILAKK